MDSILALIIVFWIVSAFSKALNAKKKTGQAGKKRATVWVSGRTEKPSAAPAQPQPTPVQPVLQDFMMPPLEPRPDYTGSLKSVSTEGRDTCDPTLGHEGRTAAIYAGSLGSTSAEGRDTCDPALGHDRRGAVRKDDTLPGRRREKRPLTHRYAEVSGEDAYAPEEGNMPELDAQTLVQGVVMSEILRRPNERKWGWR